MIVLVTGSRDIRPGSKAAGCVWSTLTTYQATDREEHGVTELVHGGARGADEVAAAWAHSQNIMTTRFAANWSMHGKEAGPRRNQQMINYLLRHRDEDEQRILVCAFPKLEGGSFGTADCVRRAVVAGFQCNVAPVPTGE